MFKEVKVRFWFSWGNTYIYPFLESLHLKHTIVHEVKSTCETAAAESVTHSASLE